MPEATDKRIEKRKKILETGYALFCKNSISGTAVDDIVKAAGIARGTFYLYFKDKSDLLEQIILFKSMDYMKTLLQESIAKAEKDGLTLVDFCDLFLDSYIEFMMTNKDILVVVQKNTSYCMRIAPDFPDPEIRGMYEKLMQKMREYGYTPDHAQRVLYIIADMVGSICSDAITVGKPYRIEEIRGTVKDAAKAILTGLRDDK